VLLLFWFVFLVVVLFPLSCCVPVCLCLLPVLTSFPLFPLFSSPPPPSRLQRSDTAFYRVVLESFHYLLRRRGLSLLKTKKIFFALRMQYLSFLDNDLKYVQSISDSDTRIVKMACEQVAYSSVKLSKNKMLGAQQLADIKKTIDAIDDRFVFFSLLFSVVLVVLSCSILSVSLFLVLLSLFLFAFFLLFLLCLFLLSVSVAASLCSPSDPSLSLSLLFLSSFSSSLQCLGFAL
jgi:hypothetical protein